MLRDPQPLFLAGRPTPGASEMDLFDKRDGARLARVGQADAEQVEQAIQAACRAFDTTRRLPSYVRQEILLQLTEGVQGRADELARLLVREAGKPLRDARAEITRMVDTLRIAAEEATRGIGEYMPLDISPRAEGCEGVWRRFPIGPCLFITPFNFPLNLAAHKIAPAIAVGCPFVLKPAPATPLSVMALGELLAETAWPAEAFSILPCANDLAERMVMDDRFAMLSFTGSAPVGWSLRAKAGRKRVTLELGGIASCIVDAGAEVRRAAERITTGAFYQAGQSCISVQRVLAHRSLYAELRQALAQRAGELKPGDLMNEDTFLGPLITEKEAVRVQSWVREGVDGGATLLCGGERDGAWMAPAWVENPPSNSRLRRQEVFGPVATLEAFDDFEEALRSANDTEFGLQAGVFTPSLDHAFRAYDALTVGAVVLNDIPSFRVDSMPYGGVKASGLGREGIRFAMAEMSEIKLLALSNIGRPPGNA